MRSTMPFHRIRRNKRFTLKTILDRNLNVTLISESPLLEHDAVYIRLQVEKAIMKRTGKETAYYKDLSEVIKK